ncbi:MAG: DUF3426 domain-containing protein [Reyranella sp.]|nr:DUF3426 domain-containing protein [Reyranella sp.]
MYTQCPECGTVFRLSADTLRIAQGEVRCGICSTVFSAVESLSDTPAAHLAHQHTGEDTITVEEVTGSEIIELDAGGEARSNAASAAPDTDHPWPPDPLIELPSASASSDDLRQDDGSLEPEASSIEVSIADDEVAAMLEASGTWERLRVAPPAPEEPGAESGGMTQAMADAIEGASEQITLESPPVEPAEQIEPIEALAPARPVAQKHDQDPTDEFPILVLDESDVIDADVEELIAEAERAAAQSDALLLMAHAFEAPEPPPPAAADPEPSAPEPPAPEPPISIPEDMRRPVDRAGEDAAAEAFADTTLGVIPGQERRRWPWAVAALLVLALAAQVVHHERATLARDPTFGPLLTRVYEALGLELSAPVDLGALELRQWGAASDAVSSDQLRFRASIVNRAPHAQPLPLLRLTVQDRFGNVVGSRDALPREYLRGAAATATLIEPGQRIDAELVIVDPGDAAVGFELQLCVPAGNGVRCANDLAGL